MGPFNIAVVRKNTVFSVSQDDCDYAAMQSELEKTIITIVHPHKAQSVIQIKTNINVNMCGCEWIYDDSLNYTRQFPLVSADFVKPSTLWTLVKSLSP